MDMLADDRRDVGIPRKRACGVQLESARLCLKLSVRQWDAIGHFGVGKKCDLHARSSASPV
jgi:hypothetical protein